MSDDLCMMPATELIENYRAKRISPVEAARAALDRMVTGNQSLNAFILVCEDEAIAAAKASEARWQKGEPIGLVDGIPTSIKDMALMKGYPTRRGSKTTPPDEPAAEDSPPTARLREHGAVLIGKTTTPEFGWKGVTDSPLTGITRNPWDPSKTSGGSSGGACAGVAVGMGALALGGDGGGSIRMPSSFCGVYGLKPTVGRVASYPKGGVGSCATSGPMSRTVADSALMLNVISLPDPRDWYGLTFEAEDYLGGLEDGVKGLKVAYSPDLGYAHVDPDVAACVRRAVDVFESLGATVEEVGQIFDDPRQAFENFFAVGMAAGYRTLTEEQRALLDPGYAEMARSGMERDLFAHKDDETTRERLAIAMNLFLEEFDLLLTPQLSLTAFEAGVNYPPDRGMRHWMDWTPFTYPFNFTGHPAASVPCGFDTNGLPVGLQIVGQRYKDALVLRASRAYEQAHPFKMPGLPQT